MLIQPWSLEVARPASHAASLSSAPLLLDDCPEVTRFADPILHSEFDRSGARWSTEKQKEECPMKIAGSGLVGPRMGSPFSIIGGHYGCIEYCAANGQ